MEKRAKMCIFYYVAGNPVFRYANYISPCKVSSETGLFSIFKPCRCVQLPGVILLPQRITPGFFYSPGENIANEHLIKKCLSLS